MACAAGDVFPATLEQTTDEQWANSIKSKRMGQIDLVRAALPFIADKGSFTLVSGVLTDEYTAGGVIGTVINQMVEGFTKAAAVELPRGVRINCISPTVLTESVTYHPFFPGFIPVDAREVGRLCKSDFEPVYRPHPQTAQDRFVTASAPSMSAIPDSTRVADRAGRRKVPPHAGDSHSTLV